MKLTALELQMLERVLAIVRQDRTLAAMQENLPGNEVATLNRALKKIETETNRLWNRNPKNNPRR